MPVYFHTESVHFRFNQRRLFKKWINLVVGLHEYFPGTINVIFTSNDYLLMINKKFLDHHYYTDVITFDYNKDKVVSGDIFVSIDQVKLNAVNYNCLFELELSRVVIHGVLHLLGFNDSSDLEKEEISRREDEALEMLKTLV